MSRAITNHIKITSLKTHEETYVRIRQVSEYFNVDRRIVLKWVDNGLLPGLRAGGNGEGEWRFHINDLRDLERTLTRRIIQASL